MAVYRYPPEVHEFVKEFCTKMIDADLAEACNEKFGTAFTKSSMKAFRGNHKYCNGRKQWTSEEFWKYQRRYPKGMYEFIRDNSWGVSSKDMAAMVNEKFGTHFTQVAMKQFRQRHGIKSGVTGWYQKGHAPGTKGKTIAEICHNDPEKLAKVAQTWYRKGHRPHNELPVGSIVTNPDGYLLRKKSMEGTQWERWEFLHRTVWEEHNGPVPEGMVVSFKDGDKANCDINNLMLITMGENSALTRLGYRFEDPDMTEAGLNVIRLKQKTQAIRKRKAQKKKEGKA